MLKPSIHDLLYRFVFPRPKQHDPTTFASFIQRQLVVEVRQEVHTFYGAIDCSEAQYPGLNYTFPPHRRRLCRFSGHRKLFRAIDELKLSDNEVLALCTWEGTKSAKERWERQEGVRIRDTTADGIDVCTRRGGPIAYWDDLYDPQTHNSTMVVDETRADADDEQSDEDETDGSVGVQLNQQLLAAADARSRGEPAIFDEAWEQWMKEALERNDMSLEVMLRALREGRPFPELGGQVQTYDPMPHHSGPQPVSQPSANASSAVPLGVSATTSAVASSTTRTIGNLQAALRELQSANVRLTADNAALTRVVSRSPTEAAR